MRKLLNKPWFVGALALGAVALVAKSLLPDSASSYGSGAGTSPDAGGGEDVVAEHARLPVSEALQAIPSTGEIRDPFAVRARVEVDGEKPVVPDQVDLVHLSAIWTQDRATLVLINDRIMQAGDEVGRIRIESATQDGVWLTHWKGRDFVALGGDFTLKTPASIAVGGASL